MAAAPATQSARTASTLSSIIAPYPTLSISFSLAIVFEDVPDDTSEWKPETAPQATVTNKIGNIVPSCSFLNPVNTGKFIVGWPITSPKAAPKIIHTNIIVVI